MLAKCEEYHAWGVPFCWVVDPVKRTAWEYHSAAEPVRAQPAPSRAGCNLQSSGRTVRRRLTQPAKLVATHAKSALAVTAGVIVLVSAAVFRIYRIQRTTQTSQQRPVPSSVSLDTKTMANDWEWGQSGNGQPQVKLFAKSFRQSPADSSRAELGDIELRIFQKDGMHYDRVRSAQALFSTSDNKLFSPGTDGNHARCSGKGGPPHQLTSITTAGINFDSKSGQAVTDQHVSFTFEGGSGSCTGARYDPTSHGLYLLNDVVLNLKGKPRQQGNESGSRKSWSGMKLWVCW